MSENGEVNANEILNSDGNLATQTNYDEIESQLEVLEKQKKEIVEAKRYPEAEILKNQIVTLQAKLNKRKKKELNNQHMNEIKLLEDKYNEEVEAFNSEWDEKFLKFEEETKANEEIINQKHHKELLDLEKQINSSIKNIKFSSQYLQLCISEETLVKQQKYNEAYVITLKKQALEKIETEKFNKETNEKNKKKIEKLQKKHLLEKSALKKKVEVELEMSQKQRDSELAKINYKFKVRKTVQEVQHQHEKKMNENEKFMKQSNIFFNKETVSDNIRNIKETKSNFFSSTKVMKQGDLKITKTGSNKLDEMQNNSVNEK